MSKLNPNAPVFTPKTPKSSGDFIFIINNGKAEQISVEDDAPAPQEKARDSVYRLNPLKSELNPYGSRVYTNHFFGWTFSQISEFIRNNPVELALDALYESVRQRVHLTNLGVLILYAVQKGEKMKNCEKRVRDAFRRFFPFQQSTEYDMYSWTFERELNWVKALI